MEEKVVATYKGSILSRDRTMHIVQGNRVTDIDELRVVQYGPQEFNLLYFNHGNEVTDTCHSSLSEALAQANFEFELEADKWVVVRGEC